MSHARGITLTFLIMYFSPLMSEVYFRLTFLKTPSIMPIGIFLVCFFI